mgnify:CR=1 FL=1
MTACWCGAVPLREPRRTHPPHHLEEIRVPQTHPHPDVDRVLLDEQQIRDRLAEIGAQIAADYACLLYTSPSPRD